MGKNLKKDRNKRIVYVIVLLISIVFIALGIGEIMPQNLNFGITWTLVFLVVLIASLINLTKPRDIDEEVGIKGELDNYGGRDNEPNVEFEFDELNRLKRDGTITEEEYDLRRKRILEKIK